MDFPGGNAHVELELEALPSGHHGHDTIAGPLVRFDGPAPAAPEVDSAELPPPVSAPVPAVSSAQPSHTQTGHGVRQAGVFAFSGFGLPPKNASKLPAYALRVLRRRSLLRRELCVAKKRGSPDVALYQDALRCADEDAVNKGLFLLGILGGAIAFVLFLLLEVVA
jgi:hypothetical protein